VSKELDTSAQPQSLAESLSMAQPQITRTSLEGYSGLSRWLHWTIAVLVLVTVPAAMGMARMGDGPAKETLYVLHTSIGVTIFVLMIGRLINRMSSGWPPHEPTLEQWQRKLSRAVHTLFYILLLAMPMVGYLGNAAAGNATPFIGLVNYSANHR
jgi:cytochrome b561